MPGARCQLYWGDSPLSGKIRSERKRYVAAMQRSSALKAAAVWWRPLQAIDINVTQETLTIAIVKPFSSSSSLFFLKLPRRLEEEEEARHCSARSLAFGFPVQLTRAN